MNKDSYLGIYIYMYIKRKSDIHIIEHLRSKHDTSDQQPMNINGHHKRIRMFVHQSVDVHVPHHETRRTTIRVLIYPLQILCYTNTRCPHSVKHAQSLPAVKLLLLLLLLAQVEREPLVPSHQLLQHEGYDGEDSRGCGHGFARLRMPALLVVLAGC